MTLSVEQSKEILSEMHRLVGATFTGFDAFHFKNHRWPNKEVKEQFCQWLADYLIKQKIVNKSAKSRHDISLALHEARKIEANYGWLEPV